jgi:ABC-type phosphate transport system permease subunit
MSLAPLVNVAAEAEASGVNHWLVGALVMLLFVVVIVALLAFGAGREHS